MRIVLADGFQVRGPVYSSKHWMHTRIFELITFRSKKIHRFLLSILKSHASLFMLSIIDYKVIFIVYALTQDHPYYKRTWGNSE